MVKPAIASTPLLVSSVIVGLCAAYVVPAAIANWPAPVWLTTIASIFLVVLLLLALLWTIKIRLARRWKKDAQVQWQALENARQSGGTTTEVTILSVQEVQPTGAWVTINWDQFGYRQPAWIEGSGQTYWPGTVLLINPDPNQVHVGEPWPPTYRIAPGACRAVAPSVGY